MYPNDQYPRMNFDTIYRFRSAEAAQEYRTSCERNFYNYEILKNGFIVFHIDDDENVIAVCDIEDKEKKNPIYINDGTVFINQKESFLFIPCRC